MAAATRPQPLETVERYEAFWNAGTSDEQRRIATEVFVDEIEYRALPGVLTGVDAMIDFRTQLVEHVGAVTYRSRTAPDHHHDRARLRWEIVLADGTSFAEGTDILTLTSDGRVSSVTAFLDRAPQGFDEGGEAHSHD